MIKIMENIPIEKNKDYTIQIHGMGFEGEGVGRVGNFTVFVEGTLPDEVVEIKIIKVKRNFAFGKLLKIIRPSKDRTVPQCSIYKRCGGCQLQHLSYRGQLDFKRQRVVDAISRIGGLKDVKINKTIGMDSPFRYRNKVQLPVSKHDEKVQIGFYSQRTHEIINMQECLIQDEIGDKVITILRYWMEKYNIEPYDELSGTGLIRHIMIRKGLKTSQVMVVIVANERKIPYSNELIDLLVQKVNGIRSIILNINTKNTNVILGSECITLWGETKISDYIGKFIFDISPLSFFQVNPYQTEVLYNKALEYADLTGNETVIDAYCGTGTISLFLAQRAKKVYGVEIIEDAVENAMSNALKNNIDNVEFIVGESEKVIPDLISKGIHAGIVVVDPPRKGCGIELLEAFNLMKPEKIVYVSCDPGTLARDLNILDGFGFRTVEIQPVDMFPQTFHTESVAKIERAKGR